MKTKYLLIIVCLMYISDSFGQTATKHKLLRPSNATNQIPIIVNNKIRFYNQLSFEKSSVIKINGPGKLRILSRGQIISKEQKSTGYEIIYNIDGGAKKIKIVDNVKRSASAKYTNGEMGSPSSLEIFEIILGPGNHNINFKLANSNLPVAARYAFYPAKSKKMEWINISPLISEEVIELVTKETIFNYYRSSLKKPLTVELYGPTELRIFSRIEFQNKMRGLVNYRIQVKMDNVVINTYRLNCKRSEITIYKSINNLVPGMASEFVVNIPKGKHRIKLLPLDSDKGSIIMRIMIPKKDLIPGTKLL